ATKATAQFFDDLIKKGQLTGDALRKLEEISPRAAQAITNAMTRGMQNTEQYTTTLDKVPVSIAKIMEKTQQMAPATDAAFQEMEKNPKTASDAIDRLKKNFDDLWDSITGPP